MVIGLVGLLGITSIPTITGVGQAVSAQQRQNTASKETEKFNLHASLLRREGGEEEEAVCCLKDGQIILRFPGDVMDGHKFCGFYFKYPGEEQHLGLVSSVQDDTPMLNWIFVDHDTHELKHGARKHTIGKTIGPWGWSDDEKLLTLDSTSNFAAKRETRDGVETWVVYWDENRRCDNAAGLVPCTLIRKPVLGVESTYVKDS